MNCTVLVFKTTWGYPDLTAVREPETTETSPSGVTSAEVVGPVNLV